MSVYTLDVVGAPVTPFVLHRFLEHCGPVTRFVLSPDVVHHLESVGKEVARQFEPEMAAKIWSGAEGDTLFDRPFSTVLEPNTFEAWDDEVLQGRIVGLDTRSQTEKLGWGRTPGEFADKLERTRDQLNTFCETLYSGPFTETRRK